MNLDIKNIASTNQQLWISIYEFKDDSYFKVVKLFPTEFLGQCKKIKINLRTNQMKSRQIFLNDFGKWILCTSGYYTQKGLR